MYTPDEQLLEPGIDDILSGVKRLKAAIEERMDHPDQWNSDHIAGLHQLRKTLDDTAFILRDLKGKTR